MAAARDAVLCAPFKGSYLLFFASAFLSNSTKLAVQSQLEERKLESLKGKKGGVAAAAAAAAAAIAAASHPLRVPNTLELIVPRELKGEQALTWVSLHTPMQA